MPSHFIWYELLTPDADAAQRFYGDVVGWRVTRSTQPGMDYRQLIAPGRPGIEGVDAGGLFPVVSRDPVNVPLARRTDVFPTWEENFTLLKLQATLATLWTSEGTRDFSLGSAHPQGGNAWSEDPELGVVDDSFAVHGFDNLFVCDASVFPTGVGDVVTQSVDVAVTPFIFTAKSRAGLITELQTVAHRIGGIEIPLTMTDLYTDMQLHTWAEDAEGMTWDDLDSLMLAVHHAQEVTFRGPALIRLR